MFKKILFFVLLCITVSICISCSYVSNSPIETVVVPVTFQDCVIGEQGITRDSTTEKLEINGVAIAYSRCRYPDSIGFHYSLAATNKNKDRLVEVESEGKSILLSAKKYSFLFSSGNNVETLSQIHKQVQSIKVTTFPVQTLTKDILFEVPACNRGDCNRSFYDRQYTGNIWSVQIAWSKDYNDKYKIHFLNGTSWLSAQITLNGASSVPFGGRDKTELVSTEVPGPGKYSFQLKMVDKPW